MKKFLSLVLALVMTMSLVTVSAGATEYKDFTDKDEIQYAEAVTVLNKLGIITGYSEGDFRPEGELTRGAAAKILVSLLIGPDAAAALGNESSPYPDVPAGNTFAGVISYCKTAKIISGYGDGTFRPQGTLTGYAFAKMLLGALGYDSTYEGFTGAGWNMNVARLGGEAGLFDRISFNGNATVTREQACQLALNTIKGTMVEYSGGMNISTGDTTMVVKPDRAYKTSNQEFATHISNRKASNAPDNAGGNLYTVEFGEEHFVDLRMNNDRNAADQFGRPSNEWSWKKVTIGTFAIEPDFVYTAQTAHLDKTDAVKNRATGLAGYDTECKGTVDGQKYTRVWVNGLLAFGGDTAGGSRATLTDRDGNAYGHTLTVEDISDLTDNGTVVEVYVSDDTADFITDVVVLKTQLMEVRRVGSDYVALQREDNEAADTPKNNAYNQPVMDVTVSDIQADDDVYSTVSGLKAGDLVAVVPVSQETNIPSGGIGAVKYDVAEVYVPETVTGALSAVETYGAYTANTKDPVSVTVGGTKYNIALWSRDLLDITADSVKVTRKDVTLFLDKNGNALKINDAGDVSGWFIVGRYYQTLVENRIVTMVEGWDTSGEKMELNLGTSEGVKSRTYYMPGDLVRYQSTTSNNADWILTLDQADGEKYQIVGSVGKRTTSGDIKASDVQIPVTTYGPSVYSRSIKALSNENVYTDKGVKFVYVTFDPLDREVESISIKSGVQEVKEGELLASKYGSQAAQIGYTSAKGSTDPDAIKVVVIKQESNDATADNLLYIRDQVGGAIKESDGTMIYCYTVAMMGKDGLVNDKMTIYSDDQMKIDTFAAYTQKEHEGYSDFYDLREHNNFTENTTSTFEVSLGSFVTSNGANVRVLNPEFVKGTGAGTKIDGTSSYNNGLVKVPEIMRDPRNPDADANGGESRHIRISSDTVFVDLRTTAQKDATGGRTIDSRDDFKWVFENYLDKGVTVDGKKSNDWRIDKVGDITFLMQLVINDNSSNNSFRTVSMVVITDQFALTAGNLSDYADAAPAQTGNDVTLTIADVGSWTNTDDVDLTDDQAGAITKMTLTPSAGATITALSKTGSLAYTAGDGNKTLTVTTPPADNDTLVVTVQAEDGSAPVSYTFTFKVTDPDAPPAPKADWDNPVASKAPYNTATNYSAAKWEDQDATEVLVTSGALTASILNTGNVAEVKSQVVSALAWVYDVDAADIQLLDERGTRLTYKVSYLGSTGAEMSEQVTYDYGTDDIAVKVQADLLEDVVYGIYNYDAVISEDTTQTSATSSIDVTGNVGNGVKVLNKTGAFSARVAAGTDPATDGSVDGTEDATLVPGYTYILNAYTTFTPGTDNSGADLDVTYVVNNETAGRATYDYLIEEGDVVKIVLTANKAIALKGDTSPANVTFGTAVENISCSKTAMVDGTPTTTTITFKAGAADALAKNDTITAVCGSVSKSDVYNDNGMTLPTVTWTAPVNP